MQEEQKPAQSTETDEPAAPPTGWEYTGAGDTFEEPGIAPVYKEDISWTASEFIAHDKGSSWYVFTGLAVVGAALVVFLFDSGRGWFSPLMILIAGGTFAFYANRKPQILDYAVTSEGVKVGNKIYRYPEFKSFSVIDEGAINSITLMPMQRFMPGLSIYFEPKDQEKIVDAIGSYLPYEDRKQDPIDKLMRKIRF